MYRRRVFRSRRFRKYRGRGRRIRKNFSVYSRVQPAVNHIFYGGATQCNDNEQICGTIGYVLTSDSLKTLMKATGGPDPASSDQYKQTKYLLDSVNCEITLANITSVAFRGSLHVFKCKTSTTDTPKAWADMCILNQNYSGTTPTMTSLGQKFADCGEEFKRVWQLVKTYPLYLKSGVDRKFKFYKKIWRTMLGVESQAAGVTYLQGYSYAFVVVGHGTQLTSARNSSDVHQGYEIVQSHISYTIDSKTSMRYLADNTPQTTYANGLSAVTGATNVFMAEALDGAATWETI